MIGKPTEGGLPLNHNHSPLSEFSEGLSALQLRVLLPFSSFQIENWIANFFSLPRLAGLLCSFNEKNCPGKAFADFHFLFFSIHREFRVELREDPSSVFASDILIENSDGPIDYDLSRVYTGKLEGEFRFKFSWCQLIIYCLSCEDSASSFSPRKMSSRSKLRGWVG